MKIDLILMELCCVSRKEIKFNLQKCHYVRERNHIFSGDVFSA